VTVSEFPPTTAGDEPTQTPLQLTLQQALDATGSDPKTRVAAVVVGALAFVLYLATLAPGITWAHQGADGGELLAAALTRGVPHPPGYPLYTMLLGVWLSLVGWVAPASEVAWRGNLLSALCGAASAGITVLTARALLDIVLGSKDEIRWHWLWAALAGMAWASSPLLWSQSILTEVYALHALIFTLFGWVLLASRRKWWLLTIPLALGAAHHITLFLLLPAALWLVWAAERRERPFFVALLWMALGAGVGALFYLYIPLVGAAHPAPVNWGYVSTWQEFWWLVSGAAYRAYLFATPTESVLYRLMQWAYTLVTQYTPIGMLLALVGLSHIDQTRPALRTFGILWIVPLSIYSIGYFTRDSEIYLLPVTWMMALWLAIGIADTAGWLRGRFPGRTRLVWMVAACMTLLVALNVAFFWKGTSLRNDSIARDFLAQVDAILPPNAIVVSRADKETFALWYGVWGSGELLGDGARTVIPVNDSLYQFAWYRRLQGVLYPELPGAGTSVHDLLEWNHFTHPVYYTEELPVPEGMTLVAEPPLWRMVEDDSASD